MNRKQIIAAFALVAITVLVYLPAMRGGFIWDDREMAVDNAVVKSPSGLRDIWFSQKLPEYHPMSYSVFWLEWRLWQDQPAGYHVINIFVHAANAVLLWLVLRKLRIPGCWLAALIFAVHPVCVASTAWIAEIKNTLSMFFYLISLLLYLRAEDQGETTKPSRSVEQADEPEFGVPLTDGSDRVHAGFQASPYIFSLVAFACALLSKISVVVLPAVLLLLAWWQRGRIGRKDLAKTAPFFLLALAAGWYGTTIHTRFTLLNDPLPARLLAGSWAVWFYLWKLIWPANLTIIYTRWDIKVLSPLTWLPGLCLLALFYLLWRKRGNWGRPVLFGLGYFVIALAPVLGLFKVVYFDFSQAADHFQYLAAPGAIALAVAGIHWWLGKKAFAQSVLLKIILAVSVLLVLSVTTWRVEAQYADMQSLWADNLSKNPRSFQALIYMGSEAETHARYAEARKMFEQVLTIKPKALEGHYNLGIVLDDLGQTDEAIAEMKKALQIKPDQADAHILMGWFREEKGDLAEATRELREATKIAPEDYRGWLNLGNVLAKQGQLDEAIQEFGQALKLKLDDPKIFIALGNVQARKRDWAAATACFRKALELDPGNQDAQKGLAAIRQSQGNPAH